MELAVKFVPSKSVDITALVCDRLANIGCYEEVLIIVVLLYTIDWSSREFKFIKSCDLGW